MSAKNELSFEKAFARLEEILEKMNSETVGLDDSLKLYEEADTLIRSCSKRLSDAEQKVQTLIKKRDGEIATDAQGEPELEDFPTQRDV